MNPIRTVLVTGGAGYVGSALVPKLLDQGYQVRVLDLYLYGADVLRGCRGPRLEEIRGDLRDRALLSRIAPGCDAVIHLACISNDPSFDLDPELGKSINYDAFAPLVKTSRDSGVRRFIYASSSSVYGVRAEPEVTENLPLTPLTDYSKFKALCEEILLEHRTPGFTVVIVRPATVCGYAPRLRLDLIVNIFTSQAICAGSICVHGGSQIRPNLHIDDMTDLYCAMLHYPDAQIDGRIYNVGSDNHTVQQIAEMVACEVGGNVKIVTQEVRDARSYHICSRKIREELGFAPRRTVRESIADLKAAFAAGRVPNATSDTIYSNLQHMRRLALH